MEDVPRRAQLQLVATDVYLGRQRPFSLSAAIAVFLMTNYAAFRLEFEPSDLLDIGMCPDVPAKARRKREMDIIGQRCKRR